MKFLGFVVLTIVLAVVASDRSIHHDGQPGCKTEEELRVVKYRNNWDPTAYWVCSVKNEPGAKERCPTSTMFFDLMKECIDVFEWYWTEPVEPPSRP